MHIISEHSYAQNSVVLPCLTQSKSTVSLAPACLWPPLLLFILDWSDLACMRALEKEMATHSSILAWRIPGTMEPGGLPSMGSPRVRHDWSDLAAAAAAVFLGPRLAFVFLRPARDALPLGLCCSHFFCPNTFSPESAWLISLPVLGNSPTPPPHLSYSTLSFFLILHLSWLFIV